MSLTRPGYLEFNLQEILANDDYAEFLHLWMALHASRAELIDGNTAWDLWIKEGEEAGQPAREALRGSITEALLTFGQGFIAHPENEALRKALSDPKSSAIEPRKPSWLWLIKCRAASGTVGRASRTRCSSASFPAASSRRSSSRSQTTRGLESGTWPQAIS